MNTVGLLLSLMPLVLWGTGDYLAAKLSRNFSTFDINFMYSIYSMPVVLVLCAIKGVPHIGPTILLQYLGLAVLLSFGFMAMVKGFAGGHTGVVAAIANAYAIVTFLVLFFVFHTAVKPSQFAAVAVIIVGIMLVSYHSENVNKKKTLHSLKYGLLALIIFGFVFAALAHVSTNTVWYANELLLGVTSFLAGMVLYVFNRQKNPKKSASLKKIITNKWGLLGGIAGSTGALGLFAAFAQPHINVVLVSAIASAAPLVTALLAYIFDHERLQWQQRLGTLVIIASVVLINVIK